MDGDRDGIKVTKRENQVLQLLSEGKTCKEIAVILKIAESTVITYIKWLKQKLNVNNSIELIYIASKLGIV